MIKKIPGLSNYGVTQDGRIYSFITHLYLNPYKGDKGYYKITVFNDKRERKTLSVHRLIALVYIPNPENKPQINHLNGIRTDNRIENLEWATCLENIKHAFKFLPRKKRVDFSTAGRKKGMKCDYHPHFARRKLTTEEVREMYLLRSQGMQYPEMESIFKVHKVTCRKICIGARYKEVHQEYYSINPK